MQFFTTLLRPNVLWRLSVFTTAASIFFTHQVALAQSSNVSVSAANNSIDPVIVTATRTPTRANDVLADYVYIGPEEIADAGQSSLVELLQRQRGVEISTRGGAGSNASVFLRGTNNAQSLVLIDGVRVESALFGGATWATIPLSLIDHIEIIFGPQSSLYGSDAIGGVIQIFTKQGDGKARVGASAGYGSYGTSISEASIYGSLGQNEKIKFNLGISNENSTGFNVVASNNRSKNNYPSNPGSAYTKTSGTGKISYEWDGGQVIGAQFLTSRLKNQYPFQDFSLDWLSSTAMNAEDINNLGTYSVFSKNNLSEVWTSLLQISSSNDSGQNLYNYSNPTTKTKQTIYTWQNDIKIGSDLLQILAERRSQNVNATFIGLNEFGGGFFPDNLTQKRYTNSLAASYQLKRGAHLANAAIRNDSITSYGPQTTGSLSYGYFLTNQWRVNINYGTAFKAPSFYELFYPGYGNTSVQPEKSKNTEVGIHYESRNINSQIVAYNNTISNLIQGVYPCPSNPFANDPYQNGCATNVGVAKISGISVGGKVLINALSLRGSFDQQNPIDQTTGFVLPKRAKQFGNIGADYKFKRATFGAEGTFSGRRSNFSNSDFMGGYTIFNLYGNYEFAKDWSVFGRWNNIFNKDYQLSYGFNTPGSNLFVGIRYAMK